MLRAAFADEAVIAAGPARGASLRDRLARSLAERLRQGARRGELYADYEPLVIAYGTVGLIQQALTFGGQGGVPRRELLENVTRFCVRALVRAGAGSAGAAACAGEPSE